MKFSYVLTAVNENPRYTRFIPIWCNTWKYLYPNVNLCIVYIGNELPSEFKEYHQYMKLFKPIEGFNTAYIAQIIRILYPALIDTSGGVMITDMDMLPANSTFFVKNIEDIADDKFISLQPEERDQLPICYVVALPSTWSEIFKISSENDVVVKLKHFYNLRYDGIHGGSGWFTDQLVLYNQVHAWAAFADKFVYPSNRKTNIKRIDIYNFYDPDDFIKRFVTGTYSDCHLYSDKCRWFVSDLAKIQDKIIPKVILETTSEITPEIAPEIKSTHIFSFCVYGKEEKYCRGMLRNCQLINEEFPEFGIVIYVGSDVPQSYIDSYKTFKQVQCIHESSNTAELMTFRFYPIDSPNVECMIVRDADSRVHKRDAWCIREFLKSSARFHIIRDHYWHKAHISGGIWGIKCGAFKGSFKASYEEWIEENTKVKGRYNTDNNFLRNKIYDHVKNDLLIHSNIVGFLGEETFPIPRELFSETEFIGAVVNFEGGQEISLTTYSDYPFVDHINWLVPQKQYILLDELYQDREIGLFSSQQRNFLLNAWVDANIHLRNDRKCQEIYRMFNYTHVTESDIIRSNDFLREFNKKVVGTSDPTREPVGDEIVIVYGSYPYSYINLPGTNKIYRHAIYYTHFENGYFECHPCWDPISIIYILNLEERKDRFIRLMTELCRMNAPLNRVHHYKAQREVVTGNREHDAYIGATKNHLEAVKHFRSNYFEDECCLILEDDFGFTSNIVEHQHDLTKFFERKYNYEVCLIATSNYHLKVPHDDLLDLSYQSCTSTSGYLLRRDTCARVLECFQTGYLKMKEGQSSLVYVCDRYWSKLQGENLFFCFKQKMGFQQPNFSSIMNRFTCSFD